MTSFLVEEKEMSTMLHAIFSYDIFEYTVNVITCVGVFLTFFQLKFSKREAQVSYEWEKKKVTIDMFQKYEAKFHNYNRWMYNNFKYNVIPLNKIIDDKKIHKNIKNYLNELEFICTAVNLEIYDIDTLDRLYGDVIERIYNQTIQYIKYMREQRNYDAVYAEFEIVAKKMMKMRYGRSEVLNSNAPMKNKL